MPLSSVNNVEECRHRLKQEKSRIIAFLVILMMGGAFPVQGDPPARGSVLALLRGYEWSLDPGPFQRLGPQAEETLMAIAENQRLPNRLRFRAVNALRLFPTDRTADFLEGIVTGLPRPAFQRRALDSFAAAFSNSRPERVERISETLLNHADPHLRIKAARTLKPLSAPSARSALERYLGSGLSTWEQKAVE